MKTIVVKPAINLLLSTFEIVLVSLFRLQLKELGKITHQWMMKLLRDWWKVHDDFL